MKQIRQLLQILAPFGEWQHEKGLQIVDALSAEKMRSNSEKFFAPEIPIYIGHPDEYTRPCKKDKVGKVNKIFQTNNGIIVCASYNESTYKKIISGEIKYMSPRWEMQSLGNGVYRPVRLVSVGLTNNPNIKGCGIIIDTLPQQSISGKSQEFEELFKLNSKASNLANKVENTRVSLEHISKKISMLSVQKGLNNFNKNTPNPKNGELSKEAINLSLKTGTPYTKAFAKLRKQMNTN